MRSRRVSVTSSPNPQLSGLELDATIINALIDKILVSEREKLADGQ